MNWTTLSEINNYGFEIQKRPATVDTFRTIAGSFIPGHGTTVEPHDYAYTDTTATPQAWFYRLKQIDLDGTIHYSPTIQIDALTGVQEPELPAAFALHQNYPNPFNPSTTIRYSMPRASFVTLTVCNLLGQQVASLVNEQQQAGYHQVVFLSEGLASGVYFYSLEVGDFVETKKLLLLR